jgi:hypothetical protein
VVQETVALVAPATTDGPPVNLGARYSTTGNQPAVWQCEQ